MFFFSEGIFCLPMQSHEADLDYIENCTMGILSIPKNLREGDFVRRGFYPKLGIPRVKIRHGNISILKGKTSIAILYIYI